MYKKWVGFASYARVMGGKRGGRGEEKEKIIMYIKYKKSTIFPPSGATPHF